MSKIEWTGQTWNVVTGCTKIAPECKNCYAIPMSHRLAGIEHSAKKYEGVTTKTEGGRINFTGKVNFDEEALLKPLKRKTPTTYFVNSMSDLFHENVHFDWVDKIFAVMALCPQHTFQILTKRADRMREYMERQYVSWLSEIPSILVKQGYEANEAYETGEKIASGFSNCKYVLPNVWLGVSCGTQASANKLIPDLLACPAKVRFLSCEPLLEKIDLNFIQVTEADMWIDSLKDAYGFLGLHKTHYLKYVATFASNKIDWVIVGGESGQGARPTHPDWVRSIRDQCAKAGTAFFFKQWGEWVKPSQMPDEIYSAIEEVGDGIGISDVERKVGKHASGRLLDGQEYNEMPQP